MVIRRGLNVLNGRREMMNKKVAFGIVMMVLVAVSARAQTAGQTSSGNSGSWTVGADFVPASMVKLSGVGGNAGSVKTGQGEKSFNVPLTKDPFLGVHFGYKPNSGLGGEFRYSQFGGHGETNGSVAQTDGTLMLWGANDTPHIVSTAPILNGPVAYTLKSSVKVSRMDFLGNYNLALPKGWLSAFGGVARLSVEGTEEITRSQRFLLYARLPNGNLDTRGIREDYAYSSATSVKATLMGLTGGVEGEYCVFSHLVIHGRVALATFPWGKGNTKDGGKFTATKDIYLVDVASGLTATPVATLAHLNLPGASYEGSDKHTQTTTAFDGQVGLKWRTKFGKASLDIGGALTRLSLSNMLGAPDYMIHDGFAPWAGMFMPQPRNVKMMAPMLTIGVWF